MSDQAERAAPALTEERARAMLRSISSYLADNLDRACRCNACHVCAATFLIGLQKRLTGPTISIIGWRVGMNKIAIGKLLMNSGLSITDAHHTSTRILENFRRNSENSDVFEKGDPLHIQVAEGVDRETLIQALRDNGLQIE